MMIGCSRLQRQVGACQRIAGPVEGLGETLDLRVDEHIHKHAT